MKKCVEEYEKTSVNVLKKVEVKRLQCKLLVNWFY